MSNVRNPILKPTHELAFNLATSPSRDISTSLGYELKIYLTFHGIFFGSQAIAFLAILQA